MNVKVKVEKARLLRMKPNVCSSYRLNRNFPTGAPVENHPEEGPRLAVRSSLSNSGKS